MQIFDISRDKFYGAVDIIFEYFVQKGDRMREKKQNERRERQRQRSQVQKRRIK